MYIALDRSQLRLKAFQLQDMMMSAEMLTHALTVHYLSTAVLEAGMYFLPLLQLIFVKTVLVAVQV